MPVPAGSGDPWPYVVTLEQVKRHGNITGDAADDELVTFIGTAQEMVEHEVGPVAIRTVTAERHTPAGPAVFLQETPVLEVTSAEEYYGTIPGVVLTADDYSVDLGGGVLERVLAGTVGRWYAPNLRVTYVVGRDPVPAAIQWAIMELTIHLWRATQVQRGGRARGAAGDIENTVAALGYALPNRVVDALAPFARRPVVA